MLLFCQHLLQPFDLLDKLLLMRSFLVETLRQGSGQGCKKLAEDRLVIGAVVVTHFQLTHPHWRTCANDDYNLNDAQLFSGVAQACM
jgi:hypothetical protein